MDRLLVVTGAAGKRSGGAFSALLSEHWSDVRSLYPGGIRFLLRPGTAADGLLSRFPDAELRFGDLADPAFLRESLAGADTVFHIAGIQLSEELTKAAADCGIRRLILVHTTGVYSKYKKAGEDYRRIDAAVSDVCRKAGIRLTVLRPTMIYGNTTDRNIIIFIKMVDRLPVMPVVRGARYALQPVYYPDLAKAYLSVLLQEETTAGKEFVLSGAEPILLRDMLTCIGEKLGKSRVRFISFPFWFAYGGALALYGLSFGRKDYREKVQRLCESRAYPHDAASEAFDYRPVGFPEGVSEEIQEYLKSKSNQR